MATDQATRDAGFTEFAATSGRPLLRTTRLLTGDRHAAEDLVQATLVRVYLGWGRAGSWDSPHAYARKAVVNLFATGRRRRWHGEVPDGEPAHGDLGRDMTGGVDTRLEVARALTGLPRAQWAVLMLNTFAERTR